MTHNLNHMEEKEIVTTKTLFGNIKEEFEVSFDNLKRMFKDGYYRKYYENGNLEISGEYLEGKKFGLWESYDYSGMIISKAEYFDDLIIKDWKIYQDIARILGNIINQTIFLITHFNKYKI